MQIEPSIYKIAIGSTIIATIFLYLLMCAIFIAETRKEAITCVNFLSQAEAQAALISSPSKYSRLDHNKNGVACEDLSNKI